MNTYIFQKYEKIPSISALIAKHLQDFNVAYQKKPYLKGCPSEIYVPPICKIDLNKFYSAAPSCPLIISSNYRFCHPMVRHFTCKTEPPPSVELLIEDDVDQIMDDAQVESEKSDDSTSPMDTQMNETVEQDSNLTFLNKMMFSNQKYILFL